MSYYTHGMSYTRQYRIWACMVNRCTKPKNMGYIRYGGRGIKVCAAWRTFDGFWADMALGYADDLTLDREDNDGNYCKENCRWVTRKQQSRNTRSNRQVTTSLGTAPAVVVAEQANISYVTMQSRLAAGWQGDDLLRPVGSPSRNWRLITLPTGETVSLRAAAKRMGVNYYTLHSRVERGVPAECLFLPASGQFSLRTTKNNQTKKTLQNK